MNTPGPVPPRPFSAKTTLLAALVCCAGLLPTLHADGKGKVQPLDRTTIAATDFTEAGERLPVPSVQAPVYYTGVNAGYREFVGVAMAGDPPPPERDMLAIVVQVLAQQGYRGADAQHPPTQVIVCSWGTLDGGGSLLGPGPGLAFVGGDKFRLNEDRTIPGHISADVFMRRFRSGAAETAYQMAAGNLYAVLLRAYDLSAAEQGKIVLLWETRIACASPGTNMQIALPRMVVSAQRVIGRVTPQPVVANAARQRDAWVEIPEGQVIDYYDATEQSARRLARDKAAAEKK